MTTRVTVQNEVGGHHDVQVQLTAPGYHGAPIVLKPGMSHSEHIWDGMHLEIHELPHKEIFRA